MMKAPKPAVDPDLEKQKADAERDRLDAVQKSVTRDTEQLLRQFGSRAALSGGTMRAPILGF